MTNFNFARLISFVTHLKGEELSLTQIQDLNEFSQPDVLPTPVMSDPEVVKQLMFALKANRKIDSIKAYRTLTGAGLKESKDAIEAFYFNRPAPENNFPDPFYRDHAQHDARFDREPF